MAKKRKTKKELSLEGLKGWLNRQAKYNREHMGKWELILYKYLKDLGYKFKCQVPIICKEKHGYIVDFLLTDYNIYCEADGKQWHSTPQQKKLDGQRTRRLIKEGYFPLRLWNKQISVFTKEEIDQIIKSKIKCLNT